MSQSVASFEVSTPTGAQISEGSLPTTHAAHYAAVIICVNYADFLEHTLRENISHFDDIVIVTSHEDRETQSLCNRMSVRCVVTDEFYANGDKFNKARGINLSISHLRSCDWIVHLDADIVLPHNFRGMLTKSHLQRDCIYGVDRMNFSSYDEWIKYRDSGDVQFRHYFMVTPPSGQLGARVVHDMFGWGPIGFCQIWHKSHHKYYPVNEGSAEHTDLLHSFQWPRNKRILLPEIIVVHLDSEPCSMGSNWKGRKTKRFGPSK